MKNHQSEIFSKVFDRGNGEYKNLSIKNCEFNNCGISLSADINQRSSASNIEIIDCKAINCAIGPAILSDAHISNLATGDLQIFWGTLFNRVKIDGKIGRLKVNTRIHAPTATEEQQRIFDDFRTEFYQTIEWAIDIRDAHPQLLEIKGIPSEKIIFNPDHCAALKRTSATKSNFEIAKSSSTPKDWSFTILDFFEDEEARELILIAPTGKSKKAASPYLDVIKALRDNGI
jgi:hypothetical protein